jgi:uncharacterized RDD family membrane protein YckC
VSAALDTLFRAETPEGIELVQRPAGALSRSLAYAVDLGLRMALMMAASMVLARVRGVGTALFFVLYFLVEWFYPVLFELLPGSATPGKRVLGLKVVMDSGLPVTPAASLLRNLLRTVDFLPVAYGFGLLSMLLRADFKRLGDLAAGTLVVHVAQVTLHAALPEAAPLAPARALSAREQAAVVSWAGRIRALTAERGEELAQLALPVLPAARPGRDATERLLGLAHWLIGRRA